MKVEGFEFDSAGNTIPTDPLELRRGRRDGGRMVALERGAASVEHCMFRDIYDRLRAGDLLVMNDSYMLSNTLAFRCGDSAVEVMVYGYEPNGATIVGVSPARDARAGLELIAAEDPALVCTLTAPYPDGLWQARFSPPDRLVSALDRFGRRSDETVPLDERHWRTARDSYRSVYANVPGSLEIPSAGLHFSSEMLGRLAAKGVEMAYVTLHVGATEILSVRHISAEEVEDHKVRPEYFEVGEEAAARIGRAVAEGRRVIAVGTTVMRTLETLGLATEPGAPLRAQAGWTDLYIYPGFRFRIVSGLLTNLHRPRSSHIVLTAAFGSTDLVMRSYQEIVDRGDYEFDMFGDCMLIL